MNILIPNSLIGNDNSLGGGLIGATVILLLNAFVAWITFRHKRVERFVEHTPTVLVKHGRIVRENLRREGIVSLRDVRYVLLEEDGHLSVITAGPPRCEDRLPDCQGGQKACLSWAN